MKLTKLFIVLTIMTTILTCNKNNIKIYSYVLRDRVIVTDQIVMKKVLFVGFSAEKNLRKFGRMTVKGKLLCDHKILSESFVSYFYGQNGNVVFDLPYEIPDGQFDIVIELFDSGGSLASGKKLTVERSELRSAFGSRNPETKSALQKISPNEEIVAFEPSEEEIFHGYVLFSRSSLDYIFPGTRPRRSELIKEFFVKVVRNEYEPISFSIYPLQNLGKVRVGIEDLKGSKGRIPKDKIEIGCVESIEETIGLPPGKFQNLPTLIRPGNEVEVGEGRCQRFWLTVRIDGNVLPGEYSGKVMVSPQYGVEESLPLKVVVAPITLEDIPGIDYFMLMTYEFTELTMPWKKEDKEKIYRSARNILRDYKEHGMTTLCFHSPFVLMFNNDGTPNLEDIFAGLRAARDLGFKRPIVWYMGHLIQTSKQRHPGSIMGFDREVHLSRLKYFVQTVTKYAKENGCPEVIFLPMDEPDDSFQDKTNKRREITPLLLKTINEGGGRTMVTTHHYEDFKLVDFFCSSELDQNDLYKAHSDGRPYWIYNNSVTTASNNPAYARFIYGYYTWKNHIDGMSSWTFQNTQNASGFPTKADSFGNDIYLAYPGPARPLPTIKWEAIREGIEDHKLIFQLQKRISELKKSGMKASKYESFLNSIEEKKGNPGQRFGDHQGWDAGFFYRTREALISMIMEADRQRPITDKSDQLKRKDYRK